MHTSSLNSLLQTVELKVNSTSYTLHILRLDLIHEQVSGNKSFKLKYHLLEAQKLNAKKIVTFGGVWSNHVIATAAACNLNNIPCKAFIRSDEKIETAMLQNAKKLGMEIEYCSRELYKNWKNKTGLIEDEYYIPEGGATSFGVQGCHGILLLNNLPYFSHIICPIGTGTTFAGIVQASLPSQIVVGINALKGGFSQEKDIDKYLTKTNWEVINDFHFGGFAKHTPELIQFMNHFYTHTKIPSDIVYTSKMFYAIQSLIKTNYFTKNDKILAIHTGGLQGNKSLTESTLIF
jgi:1-aminocyclopropane-1-carboxylate deaminase